MSYFDKVKRLFSKFKKEKTPEKCIGCMYEPIRNAKKAMDPCRLCGYK